MSLQAMPRWPQRRAAATAAAAALAAAAGCLAAGNAAPTADPFAGECVVLPEGQCFANRAHRTAARTLPPCGSRDNATAGCCALCEEARGCASWTLVSCPDGGDGCSCFLFSTVEGLKAASPGDLCVSGCSSSAAEKCRSLPPAPPAPPVPPAPPAPRPPPGAKNDTRPSILLIHVDSMDGRAVEPGSPARTPNLNALAARGVRFSHTYTAAPECVPSRSSVWSGRRNDQTMAANNGKGLDCDYPILANRLNDNGYEVSVRGRHDFNYFGDAFTPRNISNWMSGPGPRDDGSVDTPTYSPEKVALGAHSFTANVSAWLRSVPGLQLPVEDRPGWSVAGNSNPRHSAGDWAWADECVRWLWQWRNFTEAERLTRPFVMSCGFIKPHPPFETNQYWIDHGVDEANLRLPAEWPPYSKAHPVNQYDSDAKNVTFWSPRHPDPSGRLSMDYWTDDNHSNVLGIRRVYAAMCAEADAFVGSVLDALDTTGLGSNTLTVFWSDHGELAMDHASWYKMSLFEGAARVPLIVAGPGVGVASGRRVARPTSLLDLFPTALDVARAPWPQNSRFAVAGHSLVPDLRNASSAHGAALRASGHLHPGYAVTQWHGDSTNTGQFGIVQQVGAVGANGGGGGIGSTGGDYNGDGDGGGGAMIKYIHFSPLVPGGAPFRPSMYNLTADPDETIDLLRPPVDPTAAAIAARMASALRAALGEDPDAIDARFKAQDKSMFLNQTYAAKGSPSRAAYEAAMLGARWEWAWRLNSSGYFALVDAWAAGSGDAQAV